MPPRKSDSARRSDVTMAKFALAEGDERSPSAAAPLRPPSSVSASASASAAPATPAAEMETDRPSESAPPTDRERKEGRDSVTIEDLNLPKSIITRLAKGVLPPNTQIQANAVLAMSKSATVFVNHLANAANEHTLNANKKTIMPNDVFAALEDIEFPFLRERLEAEFKKFNEIQTTKRNTYRRKVAAAKAGKSAATTNTTGASKANDPNTSSTPSKAATGPDSATPRSKKQKPNGPDDSQMDVDGATEELQDASDAESDAEQEQEQDDEDDEDENEGGEEEEEDDDNEDEEHDALEEEEEEGANDDGDEALDDGGESD